MMPEQHAVAWNKAANRLREEYAEAVKRYADAGKYMPTSESDRFLANIQLAAAVAISYRELPGTAALPG
jgi:hypothetical protein